jgi:hypothetical protein
MGFAMGGNFSQSKITNMSYGTMGVTTDDSAQGNLVADILWKHMRNNGFKGTRTELLDKMAISPSSGKYLAKLIPIFIDGWGFMVRTLNMDSGKVEDAMKAIASKSKGQPPTSQAVQQALSARAQQFDWGEAIKFTAVESAKQITQGVQEVGKSVISTGKMMNFLMPAIPIVILAALFFRFKGGNIPTPRLPKRLGGR